MSEIVVNPLTGIPVDDEHLSSIADLAKRQKTLERQIALAEQTLEQLNESLAQVRDNLLPDAMDAVGLSAFTLSDGTQVEVNPFYAAKIPEDRTQEAFSWLRKNNFGSLIKRTVSLVFGMGQDQEAAILLKELERLRNRKKDRITVIPVDKENVHPQTLKAFVREQYEEGTPPPTETFGIYVGKRAKLVVPK